MDLASAFAFEKATQEPVTAPPFINHIDPLGIPQEAAAEYLTAYPPTMDQVQTTMVHQTLSSSQFPPITSSVSPLTSSPVTSTSPTMTSQMSNTIPPHPSTSTSMVTPEQHMGALQSAAGIMAQISKKALKVQQDLNMHKSNEAISTYRALQLQVQQVGNLLENLNLTQDPYSEPLQPASCLLATSDESRKRCASSLAMERPVKVFKAEPQEDLLPADVSGSSFQSTMPTMNPFPTVSRPASPFGRKSKSQSFPTLSQPPQQQQSVLVAPIPSSLASSATFPVHPTYNRASYSEGVLHTTRHSHSLSTGSIITSNATNGKSSRTPNGVTGRMSRSGSLSGIYPPHFNGYTSPWTTAPVPTETSAAWQTDAITTPISASSTVWTSSSTDATQAPDEGDRSDDEDEDDNSPGSSPSGNSDVPPEYRSEVDRIFFEFLQKTCSNLEATDTKGDSIHQTLMPKKMQRLDESKDFRPFKFRILAFTTAFLEELARQGYTEDKIPTKKIRNYLWKQPHILRFNQDGKKVKSKGNHIWKVEARKTADGNWLFRPFHRKLAGALQSTAYPNQLWSWTPHIWDPQAAWQNVPVQYTSPSLPSWLSWKEGTLSGVPDADAQSCEVTAIASFVLDGQDCQLSHTFQITVMANPVFPSSPIPDLPRYNSDPTFSRSVEDLYTHNDTCLPRDLNNPSMIHSRGPDDTITVAVLQNASQRLHSNTTPLGQPVQAEQMIAGIAVDHSLKAWDNIMTRNVTTTHDQLLASASQEVVTQAALVAPYAGARMSPVGNVPSVDDVAVVAGQAVAQAVSMVNDPGDQLKVITVAKDILKQQNNAIVLQCQPLRPMPLHPQPLLVHTNRYSAIPEYV